MSLDQVVKGLPMPQTAQWAFGALQGARPVAGGVWGIDGSGGSQTKDWRLRRRGWSAVMLHPNESDIAGGVFGTLTATCQSSP
eukprot:6178612-Pyramimonas_sp.AAC.1